MRGPFFLIVFSLAAAMPAAADQTDPRLDALFEELRVGDAHRAEENTARIIDIWSDSQSDTVDLLYERANLAANNGAFDLSLALLDHVTGLAPNFAQGYALRGTVRLTTDQTSRSISGVTASPAQTGTRPKQTNRQTVRSGAEKLLTFSSFFHSTDRPVAIRPRRSRALRQSRWSRTARQPMNPGST